MWNPPIYYYPNLAHDKLYKATNNEFQLLIDQLDEKVKDEDKVEVRKTKKSVRPSFYAYQ